MEFEPGVTVVVGGLGETSAAHRNSQVDQMRLALKPIFLLQRVKFDRNGQKALSNPKTNHDLDLFGTWVIEGWTE